MEFTELSVVFLYELVYSFVERERERERENPKKPRRGKKKLFLRAA